MAADAVIRVVVVDDHPMVREGLRSMLSGDAIEIVGEASTGDAAVRAVEASRPDVVLLDLELPDMEGLEALRRIAALAPAPAVLVITMHEEPELVRRAVQAGAAGYVLKGVDRLELLASIRAVDSGESVLDPGLLRAVVDAGDGASAGARAAPALTPVELDLLRLVANGLTNRQIGERLRWSQATVKKYVQRVLEKLDVADRTQAAVEAVRRGLCRRVRAPRRGLAPPPVPGARTCSGCHSTSSTLPLTRSVLPTRREARRHRPQADGDPGGPPGPATRALAAPADGPQQRLGSTSAPGRPRSWPRIGDRRSHQPRAE
jgi:DNA-binding NarL/FixJ family response regulator